VLQSFHLGRHDCGKGKNITDFDNLDGAKKMNGKRSFTVHCFSQGKTLKAICTLKTPRGLYFHPTHGQIMSSFATCISIGQTYV